MTNGDAIDDIRTLAGSENRVDILLWLHERGELEKRELRERADVARPTLQRNLDTLEEAGWIRRTLDGYAITVAGEMVARPFAELMGRVETAGRLEPLLRWTSAEELNLDPTLLANAEIIVSEPANPFAPVNRFVERLQTVDEFRACMAVVARDAAELIWRRVTDGKLSVELVLTTEAAETVQSDPSFTEMTRDLLGCDGFRLRVYDGDLPYFLGLLDREVYIGVEDEAGIPQALAVSTNDAVRVWAREKLDRITDQAAPMA